MGRMAAAPFLDVLVAAKWRPPGPRCPGAAASAPVVLALRAVHRADRADCGARPRCADARPPMPPAVLGASGNGSRGTPGGALLLPPAVAAAGASPVRVGDALSSGAWSSVAGPPGEVSGPVWAAKGAGRLRGVAMAAHRFTATAEERSVCPVTRTRSSHAQLCRTAVSRPLQALPRHPSLAEPHVDHPYTRLPLSSHVRGSWEGADTRQHALLRHR